ncbi:MAG: hypothetical protein IJ641_09605 [Lachnospiraceae bacterium]|nr:hypothetical protein [Lachnospiraceae bacterium]
MEEINKDKIMNIVNENENFCEIGKKVCKLHLNGFSNAEIASMTGETEDKIADTIRKMKKVVSL